MDGLRYSSGVYSSPEYAGPVSLIQGQLSLTPTLSSEIRENGSIELVLRNNGPNVQLGLPPNTLPQDLSVSFTGGPLIVGVQSAAVGLQTPEPGTVLGALAALALCCVARRMAY
jgi:hypothetical protein